MTAKRKIRYSELAPPAQAVVAPPPAVAAPVPPTAPPVALPPDFHLTPLRGTPIIPTSPPAPPPRASARPAPAAARRAAPAASLRERARLRTSLVEVLVFRVGGERFGVELAAVEEAVDLPPVHHVPEMPPAMLGVAAVRGALTSVFTPQAPLGVALTDGASALIFRRGTSRLALAIDDVDDVFVMDLRHLRDAPGVDAGDGVLLGVARHGNALLSLVDAEALLAACQAEPLLETA